MRPATVRRLLGLAAIVVMLAIMLVPTLLVMRGRWARLRPNVGKVVAYGTCAIAGCQLFYFNAVNHLSVGVALLLEYLAPVLIVGWFWARHGRRRTGRGTSSTGRHGCTGRPASRSSRRSWPGAGGSRRSVPGTASTTSPTAPPTW